jgi:hypothetical protein
MEESGNCVNSRSNFRDNKYCLSGESEKLSEQSKGGSGESVTLVLQSIGLQWWNP